MTDRRAALLVRHRGLVLCHDSQAGLKPLTTPIETDCQTAVQSWTRQQTARLRHVRTGTRVHDETGAAYVPVLVDSNTTGLDTTATTAWVEPPELCRRETTPLLWQAYDAVRPTVETIAEDTTHGSTTLSVRALELLRDEAIWLARDGTENQTADRQLETVARRVREARPSMAVIRNRLNRVMDGVDLPPQPLALARAAQSGIQRAYEADRDAATAACSRIEGERVATLSRSGTVLRALEAGSPDAVLVAVSRPGGEGVDVAEALAAETDVTLTTDAAFPAQLSAWGADSLLVGADAIGTAGQIQNKVGTYPAAAVATREEIPVLVAAATDKVATEMSLDSQPWPEPLYSGSEPIARENPTFEVTPPECVDSLLTEQGAITPETAGEIAEAHRRLAAWDESTQQQ